MTGKERVINAIKRKPLDRIPAYEHFWPETIKKWKQEGFLAENEFVEDHFDLDMLLWWAFDLTADLDRKETVLSEDENTRVVRNGNGAVLRYWKNKSGTPEHIDFEVKTRKDWEDKIRPLLMNKSLYSRRRQIRDWGDYAKIKQKAASRDKFFCCSGLNVFECMHPVCGHENMLMGMALDPDWIKDMCEVYSNMIIELMDALFMEYGRPDCIWFCEDMGFKNKPFMSPQMYRELIWPAHKKTFDYAHDIGLPVIMHSCGFVEAFIPMLIEAGLDCLQAMEVKAGMDVVMLKRLYGDKLTLIGGLDIRELETNQPQRIKSYLDARLPTLKEGGGFILHTDHSIPDSVNYQTYKYFLEYGLKLGTY